MTWGERKARWKIREIAREEMIKGNKVRIGNDKISVNGQWWFWDEEREILVDKLGREKGLREGWKMGKGEENRRAREEEVDVVEMVELMK